MAASSASSICFSLAFERADVDVEHRSSRLLRAHHRVACPRPGEDEPRVERLAAERIMPGAKGVPHDQA